MTYMLLYVFYSGADTSFVTLTFKQLLNHEYSQLDVAYEVEVANGRIERTTKILINCLFA